MSSERQEYNEISPWWGEHVHRYHEAIKHLKPADKVLDLACGNGYGTFLLANHTDAEVIGGDIDSISVDECSKRFTNPNLKYLQLDGTKLDFSDASFDVIVSFETIEHTKDFDKMCSEFFRILKPGGYLILSTPNFLINSPKGFVENPFHTQEFELEELKRILSMVKFSSVNIMGQKYNRYGKTGIKYSIAAFLENFFYLRGIRKIPLSIQNEIIKLFIGKTQYPDVTDYILVSDKKEILGCKTFFAVCIK